MRRSRQAPAVLAGVLAVALGTAVPAAAHDHPSGITDLVTPAVVWIEAEAKVDITLLDHVGDLIHVERSYDVPIGKGTGVVVTPEGAVVTLTKLVKSERDVAVYAANRIFADHHKVKIDADFSRHKLKDPILNRHLQQCYPPKRPTATCLIDVSTEITVYPNISTGDREGFKAKIAHAGDSGTSPAVLVPTGRADGGVGLPTAPLARQVPEEEGAWVTVAGFTGRPSDKVRHTTDIAHLTAGGASEKGRTFKDPDGKVDEPAKLGALADKGLIGGPIIGDKDGSVVGMLIGGGKNGRMIGIKEITKALEEAKITPRRGPIDSAFEVALTRFHNKYYGDAVPAFQRVLELFPGHVVAAEHLKTAQQKRGGPEDAALKAEHASAESGQEVPLWPFIVAGVVLLLALLAGPLLLWRRRASRDSDDLDDLDDLEELEELESLKALQALKEPDKEDAPSAREETTSPPEPAPSPPRRVPVGAPVPGDSPPPRRRAPYDESADATVVVGRPRSFPPLPKITSTGGFRPPVGPAPAAKTDLTSGDAAKASSPAFPSATPPLKPPPVDGMIVAPAKDAPKDAERDRSGTRDADRAAGPGERERTAGPGAVRPSPSLPGPPSRPLPQAGPVQKFCTQCGMNLGPAHKFCGYCGHPVET